MDNDWGHCLATPFYLRRRLVEQVTIDQAFYEAVEAVLVPQRGGVYQPLGWTYERRKRQTPLPLRAANDVRGGDGALHLSRISREDLRLARRMKCSTDVGQSGYWVLP